MLKLKYEKQHFLEQLSNIFISQMRKLKDKETNYVSFYLSIYGKIRIKVYSHQISMSRQQIIWPDGYLTYTQKELVSCSSLTDGIWLPTLYTRIKIAFISNLEFLNVMLSNMNSFTYYPLVSGKCEKQNNLCLTEIMPTWCIVSLRLFYLNFKVLNCSM